MNLFVLGWNLREELPADRLMGAMAVISGVLGFGGGVGLVITGLLMRGDAGYHRVFWFTTAFSVVVIAAVAKGVPNRPRSGAGSVDWAGAAGLAVGLSAVLTAITQGNTWGWTAPRTLGCAAGGVTVLGLWWWWERRSSQPLVSTAMLLRRPILLTNVATVSAGMGLYCVFLGLTGYVQAPVAAGYGLGASVLYASVVYLLPGALAGFLTALVSGRLIDRFGARPQTAPNLGHRRQTFGQEGEDALPGDASPIVALLRAGFLLLRQQFRPLGHVAARPEIDLPVQRLVARLAEELEKGGERVQNAALRHGVTTVREWAGGSGF